MPYLRLTCPELDAEHRQTLATRLTDAINDLLFDPRGRLTRDELRERTTVHFTPYAPGELFIGGRTPEARGAADVTLELSDWGMSARQRRRLAATLTPVLAELFGVPPEEGWGNLNIRLHVYRPSEFAVGGRLLSDLVPLVGRLLRRLAG
jgi:phenylpyruvate tautomerase PptA (4-oxalocrotonate tautomerase family)